MIIGKISGRGENGKSGEYLQQMMTNTTWKEGAGSGWGGESPVACGESSGASERERGEEVVVELAGQSGCGAAWKGFSLSQHSESNTDTDTDRQDSV